MHLTYQQMKRLKTLGDNYGLTSVITHNSCMFEDDSHVIQIRELDLRDIQKGIRGYLKAIDKLSRTHKRNMRIESSDLSELEYVNTVNIRTDAHSRFDCDFSVISLVKTKHKNFKTMLQDSTHTYIFTGNHFDEVLHLVTDSPARFLKRTYPKIYNYLIKIEATLVSGGKK